MIKIENTHTEWVYVPSIYGSRVIEVLCADGCDRCPDIHVPHFNCLYGGKAVGHSAAHCTANACY